jgi:hypothetical protein
LAPLLFELVDGHDADARSISQVLLAPRAVTAADPISFCLAIDFD